MVMNRHFDDADVIDALRANVNMPRTEANAIVERDGVDGLRLVVGARLYHTVPMLSSGEAARRVGLQNRGLLLRYLIDNQISPAEPEDEDSEAVQEQLLRSLDKVLPDGWRPRRASDN